MHTCIFLWIYTSMAKQIQSLIMLKYEGWLTLLTHITLKYITYIKCIVTDENELNYSIILWMNSQKIY